MTAAKVLDASSFNPSAPFYGLVLEVDEAFGQIDMPVREWLGARPKRRPTLSVVPSSTFVARSEYPEPPGEWVADAACKTERMWYRTIAAHAGRTRPDELEWEARMLAICQACPVLSQCREWALGDIEPATDHIAGGLTPRQRWEIRRGHPR